MAARAVAFLLLVIATAVNAADETPQWVWSADTSSLTALEQESPQDCSLARGFNLPPATASATLRLVADFCRAKVEINGQPAAIALPYGPAVDADVLPLLRAGANRIVIEAVAVPGPAAVAVSLSITAADGSRRTIVTDGQWQATDGKAAVSLGAAEPALFGIGSRPPTVDPFDNYEQWRQATGAPPTADAASFWTAPGFEISLVRAAQGDESSWVSLAFDGEGRATIAREDQGLLRMTLSDDRRSVTKVETIDRELQECRGLLYAHGALYASANNSQGLYRLRDTSGDDQFDETRLLRQLPGSVGHGRNDITLGPDGRIYWISGDSVDVPKEKVLDRTSPFREARRGANSREGFVLRTDREGMQWELVAAGLRNPFGIAVNERGDAFTYDADAEFDMGSPWYRPTRVVQLTSGADFGWRGVTGKWPPYFPDHADNALPALDIGRGSPTAVMFGTALKFPAEYRRALFILDWTYGRILAVHLLPRGAGYRAAAETFLKGLPLNVTDLATGPDGALYLVTGGRKTQSALYRIAYSGDDLAERSPSPHESACRRHADAARALRLQLEAHHQPSDAAVEFAWPHLDSPDPKIRYAARLAIEHQPVDRWREGALHEDRPLASLTALAALARSGENEVVPAVLDRLLTRRAGEGLQFDLDQLQLFVQTAFLCQQTAPQAVAQRRAQLLARLDSHFPLPQARIAHAGPAGTAASASRDLARLLAQLEAPQLIERTIQSLLASPAQEDRLLGLFVLRDKRDGWTKETRRAYFTALNEGAKFVAGEGMPKFLAQIREQAVAMLRDAERQELGDLLQPVADTGEALPPPRPLVKHWTSADFASLARDIARGDAQRGETVFRDALCIRCHRAGARGPAVGPELTHVAGRFGPRDLLDSILSPNKVIAENYRNVQLRTTDGRSLTGRVLMEGDFRSEKLRLATQPLAPGEIVELDKKQIEEVRESGISPMPEGLLDGFQSQDILDLLAFLTRGKSTSGP
jgi:putative heme-binding domain-containing protein